MQSSLSRSLARSYTTPDGKLTFWMLPYKPLRSLVRVDELETLKPQQSWTHQVTGAVVTTEPADWKAAVEQAKAFETEPQTPWQQAFLWTSIEQGFAEHEPLLVDLEVGDDLNAEQQALALYVQHRTGDTAQDYVLFRELLTPTTLALLALAYALTRDLSMGLPKGKDGETDDPQPASGDLTGTAATASTSKSSPKPSEKPKRDTSSPA